MIYFDNKDTNWNNSYYNDWLKNPEIKYSKNKYSDIHTKQYNKENLFLDKKYKESTCI